MNQEERHHQDIRMKHKNEIEYFTQMIHEDYRNKFQRFLNKLIIDSLRINGGKKK
jgi:hypothetical protein